MYIDEFQEMKCIGMKWNEMDWNEMEWNGIKWNGMLKWNEVKWTEMNWTEAKRNRMKLTEINRCWRPESTCRTCTTSTSWTRCWTPFGMASPSAARCVSGRRPYLNLTFNLNILYPYLDLVYFVLSWIILGLLSAGKSWSCLFCPFVNHFRPS